MMGGSSRVFVKAGFQCALLPLVLEHLSIYGIFLVVLTPPIIVSDISNHLAR